MRTIKWILLFWLGLTVFSSWAAQTSPVPMLEERANQILSTLKANKGQLKKNHHIIYQSVQQQILPIVDVDGMSRSVLGRAAWNKATSAEKQAFSQAFTQLVIRTYASPLAEYNGETVKFLPLRASNEGRFIRVNSLVIRPNGQKIPISYSLVSKNDTWKIYDLSVEGVSLLQSFRNQFGQILQNSSLQELIAQMRKNTKAA